MTNLDIYNAVRVVPDNAKKEITGGRLKGMTDINPMWRIQTLTQIFGTCGIGWWTTNVHREFVDGANGEKIVLCDLDLYVVCDGTGKPSAPIHGTGGAMFISNEKNGAYTDDECFKKAYTDAISVACKALGIGADVYWSQSTTKYTPNVYGAKDSVKTNTQADVKDIQQKPTTDVAKLQCEKCLEFNVSEKVASFCKTNRKDGHILCYDCQKTERTAPQQAPPPMEAPLIDTFEDFEIEEDSDLPF